MNLFCFLFLYFCSKLVSGVENVEIEISDGKIKGQVLTSKEGREFYAFQSIPYAEPPLGNLRFKSPLPVKPWEGVLDGTKPHTVCPQKNTILGKGVYEGNEDCLYLNVYTSNLTTVNGALPVMVFIHGGAFFTGTGNYLSYQPEYLLDHNIVLVTLNYRLGILGFLSTGDEHSPGNYGLKDQNLALKWVQKNIARFGGNPEKVTIFGESAGAASTHYQMISPLSQGLFKGVISQSGTTLDLWAYQAKDEIIKNTKELAKSLNCTETSNENLVECLRQVDAQSIVESNDIFLEWDTVPVMTFGPVVEPQHPEAFLPDTPENIISKGNYQDVPWMVGINEDEGLITSSGFIMNPELFKDLSEDINNKLAILTSLKYISNNPNAVTEELRKFYLGNIEKLNEENSFSNLTKLFGDAWFVSGFDKSLNVHLNNSKQTIYTYLFDYQGSFSFSDYLSGKTKLGVCHADDLLYLFPMIKIEETETDEKMRKLLTTLWVNFAKTGNPTSELNEIVKTKWSPIQTEKHEYYFINDEIQEMRSEVFKDRVEFWRNLKIYPKDLINKRTTLRT